MYVQLYYNGGLFNNIGNFDDSKESPTYFSSEVSGTFAYGFLFYGEENSISSSSKSFPRKIRPVRRFK